MNIIIFGPPGAGKGTQGDKLVKDFKLLKISTGDLLRKEVENNTTIGIEIKSIIDKGSFVSDKIINNLIEQILLKKNYINRLIFDGYPRNLNQAENLDLLMNKHKQKISCVLSLNVDEGTVKKRILGRVFCTKCGLNFNKFFYPPNDKKHRCGSNFLQVRSDDNEITVKNRLITYEKQTKPIINHYKKQNLLHEIDGKNDIPAIYKEICQIINSIDT